MAASGKAAGSNAAWLRALAQASAIDAAPGRIFPDVIDALAQRFGEAPALLSSREHYSFTALSARSWRYSRWALDLGLPPATCVALLMSNRPDYLAAWIGLSRVGVVVALLNTNLTGASLAHCVGVAAPAHAIVEDRLLHAWSSASPFLSTPPVLWVRGDTPGSGFLSLDAALLAQEEVAMDCARRPSVTTASPALLVYTSGTTGLPKAARVSHHRVMMWSHWFAGMIDTGPGDRMYDCLPLYHSVGGVVATGAPLVNGGSVVIAERFSARGFWADVIAYDCNLIQYIGELCRYLVGSPPAPTDRAHRVRLACGNGLRADVWEQFKTRFAIPQILEFYAATEGNFSLYNVDGKPGAIGRVPSFMSARFSAAIVRHDLQTGSPVRGAEGLCLRCEPGEAGEAIGRISASGVERAGRFEGYTAPDDTDRKVLRDVFARGDAWFRTGDLMRLDRQGYFTFVDRIGDTFRWKGENVATTEVAEVLADCRGVADALVYGVAVPGTDGRAGMAALVVEDGFDPAKLRVHLTERLPAYARPVFLRLCTGFEVTDTFKQKKTGLAAEGFDPSLIADPLLADVEGAYRPLDAALFRAISTGSVRIQ